MKKFGAKRITALTMALALVTIGGVYATWQFAESTMTGAEGNFSISIAAKTGTSTKGTYSVSKSALIYIVDQYSSAVGSLVEYSTSTTYTGSGYDYVQTGAGIDKTTNDPTGYDTVSVYSNYAYKNSSTETTYYQRKDYVSYTTSTTNVFETTNTISSAATTTAPSDINNYTAALCTYAGSSLRIKFVPDSGTSGTDSYENGILTTFNFTWNSDNKPTIALDDNGYYDSSVQDKTDVYNLDTDTYKIYPYNATTAERKWSKYDENGEYYFYYDITGEELVTFLTINKIILTSSSDYYAFLDEAQSAAFTLNVNEDTATVLATPTLSGTTGSVTNTVTLTLPDVTNYYNSNTVSYYLISIYDGTDSVLTSNTHLIATINAGTGTSFTLTASHFKSLSSGTYYIRVRAIAVTSDVEGVYYENSELSTNYVTVTWTEGVGGGDGTLTYSASNLALSG